MRSWSPVLVAVLLVAAGCAKRLDTDGTRARLVEQGLSQEEADCLVARLDAAYGDDQEIIEILASSDGGAVTRLSPEDQQVLVDIDLACTGGRPPTP